MNASASSRPIDAVAVRRCAQRLALAAEPPWLHGEVARRMAQRLGWIKRTPASLLQWSGHLGASDALLQATYPSARRAWVEPAPALAARARQVVARPWWALGERRRAPELIDAAAAQAASVQLLWSNMWLHFEPDPPALFSRWQSLLQKDGFLMYSTLGPGTAARLRQVYREHGWGTPAAPLVDMHDLGDMMVAAGFADPVMDQEDLVLSWADPAALLSELRALGVNADPSRFAGLRTPRWQRALLDALEVRSGDAGRVTMNFEIVYGHAFCAGPRPAVAAVTQVDIDDFRRMVRRS